MHRLYNMYPYSQLPSKLCSVANSIFLNGILIGCFFYIFRSMLTLKHTLSLPLTSVRELSQIKAEKDCLKIFFRELATLFEFLY